MHCSKPSFLFLLSGIQHAQKVLTHFSEKSSLTQKYEKETSTLTKHIITFQQITFRYLVRTTGSYDNAMKEIEAKEKEAQKLLKTVQNTAKGVYQYICFLRYLKVHDQ